MATVYVNVSLGTRRASGKTLIKSVARGTAVSGDVTVVINTTTVTLKSQLSDAVQAAIDTLADALN
jgi:hypothetical protein